MRTCEACPAILYVFFTTAKAVFATKNACPLFEQALFAFLSVYPVHLAVQLIQTLVIVFVMRGRVLYIYIDYVVVVYAESPVAHALMYKLDGPRPSPWVIQG